MIRYWDYSVSSLSSSSAIAICDSVTVTTVVSGSVTKWTSLSCASDRSFTLIVSPIWSSATSISTLSTSADGSAYKKLPLTVAAIHQMQVCHGLQEQSLQQNVHLHL